MARSGASWRPSPGLYAFVLVLAAFPLSHLIVGASYTPAAYLVYLLYAAQRRKSTAASLSAER